MKTLKHTFIILIFICLKTSLFADIAPNPIRAKTISSRSQTSIRMESEKVIIDLYNDSSVVKCSFYMKNLGEMEKLKIGFPEMHFYHYRIKSIADDVTKFSVMENGEAIQFDYSESLSFNEEYLNKVESFQIKEEWYLWDSEFQKGESKLIEIQYSLPFGMLYKSNKRFFTYLLSTGADWEGTIGKAEIIVNLKDIAMDSLISKNPTNCEISGKQLIWTFLDFEPTTKHDINIYYNSNKEVSKERKPSQQMIMLDGKKEKDFDLNQISPSDIAYIELHKKPVKNKNYPNNQHDIVEIYTKEYFVKKLEKLLDAKTKMKIVLPEYDIIKENYSFQVNESEVDISKIISIEKKSIANLEIIRIKDDKVQIKIKTKRTIPTNSKI